MGANTSSEGSSSHEHGSKLLGGFAVSSSLRVRKGVDTSCTVVFLLMPTNSDTFAHAVDRGFSIVSHRTLLYSHTYSLKVPSEKKKSMVKGVFTSVAHNYDVMNDLMSAGEYSPLLTLYHTVG